MSESNVEQLNPATVPVDDLLPMPMPGGKDQFWNLLAFLADYKSFDARLKKLEAATKKHNDTIKDLGGLKNLTKRESEISGREADAQSIIDQGDTIISNAQSEAQRIIQDAAAQARANENELGILRNALNKERQEFEQQIKENDHKAEVLARELAQLTKDREALTKLQTEAEEMKLKAEEKYQIYEKLLKSLTSEGGQPSEE